MNARRIAAVVALAIAVVVPSALASRSCVESDLTWREKRVDRLLQKLVDPFDRFVDIGVILKVVVKDPEGETLIPGKPKLRVLREHELGGVLDTVAEPPAIVRRTENPVVWFCSPQQEEILFYDGGKSQIIRGSEGSGKSRLLAMSHYVDWLALLGEDREIGQTAPTKARLKHVRLAMLQLFPPSWYRYTKSELLMTMADGHRIQFVSAKIQSEAVGSPLQGFNFSRTKSDELQDHDPTVTDDLESRGREAEGGLDFGMATCTASDKSAFRNLVARKVASGDWLLRTLLIADSPFIWPEFLERKRRVMTDREFRRRYYAEELPPERMLYFNWSREHNLRPIPAAARKITSHVLRRIRLVHPRSNLLVGHDPGASKGASIFLDAYELKGEPDWLWWVRFEIIHQRSTTEQNADAVLDVSRRRFGCNVRDDSDRVHVRAHPFGQAEDKPSEDLYRTFRRRHLDTHAAQYKKNGTGTGLIKKEDRIEMINRLLCDADGRRRLFVECDVQGQPMAPRLVESLETMERDEQGLAETEKKDENDLSDPPAGLGYGLWPWENEKVATLRAFARGSKP